MAEQSSPDMDADAERKQLMPQDSSCSPPAVITAPPTFQMSREIMEHAAYLQATFHDLLAHQDIDATFGNAELSLVEGKLTGALVSARALLNRKPLINKIPPELLATIFEYDQDSILVDDKYLLFRDDHQNMAPYRLNTGLRWMRIRLVCRRWRDIADSRASLWTTIYVQTPHKNPEVEQQAIEHVERFLRNSRLAPLRVSFIIQGFSPFKGALDVLQHAQRIQTLKVVFSHCVCSELQDALTRTSAPSLVALELDLRGSPRISNSSSPPFRMFEGGMPMLQSLYIRSGSQPATHGFQNLKQLHLSCLCFKQYTWRAFLDVIRSSNLTLEDFVLTQHDERGPDSEAPALSTPRIRLPKLKKLILSSAWGSLTSLWISFLRCLDIPADVYFYCASITSADFTLDHVPCFAQNLLPSVSTVKLTFDLIYPTHFGRGDVAATGNTFACQLTNIDDVERFIQKTKKLFVNTQDLWVEYWLEPNYPQERLWPPLKRIIRLYCVSEDAFWLPSLRLRYPFLREIHILKIGQLFSSPFLSDIQKLLQLRQENSLPVEAVYVYLFPANSPEYWDTYNPWDLGEEELAQNIASIYDQLGAYTRIEVVREDTVPEMQVPEHCRMESGGLWKYDGWED